MFIYKVTVAGASTTTLNITGSGGTALGAKTIYRNSTGKLTTHYPVGSYIQLYYSADLNSGSFIVMNDYHSDTDKKTASENTSSKIFLIGATSQSTSGQRTYSHDTAYVGTDGYLYSNSKKVDPDHTHGYSGTTSANSGTAVTAVTGVAANGTATALTGVKVSSSSSAAPGGHTHSYDKTTGVDLVSNTATDTGRIKYVESISSTGASASGTAKAGSETHTHSYSKAALSGSNTTHTTKYMKFSAGTTPISSLAPSHTSTNSGANSGNAVSAVTGVGANGTADVISEIEPETTTAVTNISGGSGSLTSNDTTSGIQYVKSISGGSGSLTSYNAATGGTVQTSSGRVPYLHNVTHTPASLTGDTTFVTAQGTFSAGTTPVSSASPSHTDADTGANSGNAVSAVTGVSGGSGSLTSNDTASGGIAYIASASHSAASLGTPSTADVSSYTHKHNINGNATITRGTAPSLGSATVRYLSASYSNTLTSLRTEECENYETVLSAS